MLHAGAAGASQLARGLQSTVVLTLASLHKSDTLAWADRHEQRDMQRVPGRDSTSDAGQNACSGATVVQRCCARLAGEVGAGRQRALLRGAERVRAVPEQLRDALGVRALALRVDAAQDSVVQPCARAAPSLGKMHLDKMHLASAAGSASAWRVCGSTCAVRTLDVRATRAPAMRAHPEFATLAVRGAPRTLAQTHPNKLSQAQHAAPGAQAGAPCLRLAQSNTFCSYVSRETRR